MIGKTLTLEDFASVTRLTIPWRIAVLCEIAQFQVADRESDDGGLVELTSDGGG